MANFFFYLFLKVALIWTLSNVLPPCIHCLSLLAASSTSFNPMTLSKKGIFYLHWWLTVFWKCLSSLIMNLIAFRMHCIIMSFVKNQQIWHFFLLLLNKRLFPSGYASHPLPHWPLVKELLLLLTIPDLLQ